MLGANFHVASIQEAGGSSEAIASQFVRIYLAAASANFFKYRVLTMPCHKHLQHHLHRGTSLRPHIYSRLWLFQISRAASGIEVESIYICRMSLSFRVQQNIIPLLTKNTSKNLHKKT